MRKIRLEFITIPSPCPPIYASPVEPDGFYKMTPFEIATGWVAGMDPPFDGAPDARRHPLDVLKDVVRPALETGRCLVSFSGGRDSSAVLAVAVDVARQEGFDLPVPVTQVYPGAPETDESEWQELVLRHLGIADWERLTYTDGESDFIGPGAAQSLRRIGLVWPPALHTKERVWAAARGGTLLTGEGGDEVFGIRRITPITGLLRRQVISRRLALRMGIVGLAPRPLRRRITTSEIRAEATLPWLTESAQAEYTRALVTDAIAEPLRWNRSIVGLLRRRAATLGARNLAMAAAAFDTTLVDPLLDRGFVSAFADLGGVLGFPGRSAVTRKLFGQLLPESVITRRDKIYFNRVFFGEPTRQFARDWNGEAVDTSLVLPDQLKRAWEADMPHAGSAPSLQAAWLNASQGSTT
jgi:asparagine synthase (glutamine-hydrolysing)